MPTKKPQTKPQTKPQSLSVPVYNSVGEKAGMQELNSGVFGVKFSSALVHQVVVAQQASARQNLAHTKGRSEVRGGGKKPWRQKGTGRARHGSIRSPLWSGGGITFGPTKEKNFSLRINKKMRQSALRMVLSDKVKNDRLVVIEDWNIAEPKTKILYTLLQKLPVKNRKTMLITAASDAKVLRASKNIPTVQTIGVGSLNVVDLIKGEYLVAPKAVVEAIEKQYAAKK